MLLACALLLIALATLWPTPGAPQILGWCVICGSRGLADLILNIVLFMPLGAALALRGRARTRIALLALILSTAIELAQFYIPGRDPSLSDVAANTCGAVLGALVVTSATTWLSPSRTYPPARASRLCRMATVLAALMCLATGLLLTPRYPDSPYFGLWTPELGHLEQYRGHVLSAMLNGEPISDGPIHATDRVRDALRSPRGFDLEIRAIAGPQPNGLAPLFAIYDQDRREILMLGLDRQDLVLRIHLRANDARLDRPDLRIAGSLRSGDTVTVSVVGHAHGYDINGIPHGFTVGHGWGLLLYLEHLPFKGALRTAWIAALFLPAGFWARTRADAAIIAAGLLASLVLVPAGTALQGTPLVQWLGAALGLAVGTILQRAISGKSSAERRTM